MGKTTPISVRLEDDQHAFVQALAKKYRVKDADIIRWAVDALQSYVELHGGNLHLPIDFTKFWVEVEKTAQKQSGGKPWTELSNNDAPPAQPRMNEPAEGWKAAKRATEGQTKAPPAKK